ncbi:MAG: hypothetical protein ACOYJD_02215 [Christensenellales bacterium]
MPAEKKSSMLLFCKEVKHSPHSYVLYFTTLETLSTESPRIHRLKVRRRKHFEEFTLGGIYDLTIRRISIVDFKRRDQLNLTEELYISLMELRQLRFMDAQQAEKLRAKQQPLFNAGQYYSFQETRDITSYSPSFFRRLAVRAIEAMLYISGVVIPLSLYMLLLYSFILRTYSAPVGNALAETVAVPLVAIGALPMMLYLMLVCFSYTDILLLSLGFSKWYMLKRNVLSGAGVRSNLKMPDAEKRRLIKILIICGGILILSLIIAFLLSLIF